MFAEYLSWHPSLALVPMQPQDCAAGAALQRRLNQRVDAGAPLCSIHAESPGELDYAAADAVSDGPIVGSEAP